MRLRLILLPLLILASPLAARDSLGVYGQWGAFRDDQGPRCYAVAKPARSSTNGQFAAFAAVSNWPASRIRGQLHFRTSRALKSDTTVTLRVGSARFTLTGSANNAWAENARDDAAIVAAMRDASSMVLSARDPRGRPFSDTYDLSGAASAIDAASVGCTNRR